jgi:hypothetical protein
MSVRGRNGEVRRALDQILDDKERFREWLAAQGDEREFRNDDMCRCPLHEYLVELLAVRGIELAKLIISCDDVRWQIEGGGRQYRHVLPDWAEQFSTLDHDMGEQGIVAINWVKAIDMLDSVKQRAPEGAKA